MGRRRACRGPPSIPPGTHPQGPTPPLLVLGRRERPWGPVGSWHFGDVIRPLDHGPFFFRLLQTPPWTGGSSEPATPRKVGSHRREGESSRPAACAAESGHRPSAVSSSSPLRKPPSLAYLVLGDGMVGPLGGEGGSDHWPSRAQGGPKPLDFKTKRRRSRGRCRGEARDPHCRSCRAAVLYWII